MNPEISRRRALATLALAPAALSLPAIAQSPALPKTMSFLVPQNAGGSNDLFARAIAARLPKFIDSNVVVENRPGANGNVGAAWVARSAPKDGSVWLVTINSSQTVNPSLFRNPGFDPVKDFEAVCGIAVVPHVLLANNAVPIHNMTELLAQVRKDPAKYSYGSSGNGTWSHLLMEMMKTSQKVQVTHVPYKGVAPAITDLIGGQIQLLISTVPAAMPFIKSGQVRPLAITSANKVPALPDVPIAADVVPSMIGDLWIAIYAPRGTPRAAIEQMRNAVAKVQALPEMDAVFAGQGATPFKVGPAELETMTREELAKWTPVVKSTGMTVD
jgi:tripartite-type tricarboxylate transporter receptor subunit TctC